MMLKKIKRFSRLIQLGISYKLKLLKPINPPHNFAIEATNRCNFKCSFCPQSSPTHKDIRAVGELTIENFRIFIKKIKLANSSNKTFSICLDGEPLMNKNFPKFIKIANEEGMFPRFSSNGRLLSKTIIDEISNYNFLASIDFSSEEKVFDSVRGRESDFKVVLDNLRYLLDKAVDNSGIKVEIIDITHFDKIYNETESLKKMRSFFPSDLPSNIKFWSRKFHNFGGHLQSKEEKTKDYKLCPYPWTSFDVTWDGNVVACCRDTAGKTILGNVFEESVMDIWRGEKYMRFRKALIEKRVEDVAACEKCDMPYSASSERWKIKYMLSVLFRR